jgi:hypothetical protein
MFNRLFTFGCSFTNYKWITWADICGFEAKEFYNLGSAGSGNLQAFIKLMEVDKTYHLTPDDTVMIMWTCVTREDRTINSEWLNLGNIYNQYVFSKDWVEKFADAEWYLKRDLALIASTIEFLKNRNIKYHMLQMVPVGEIEFGPTEINNDLLKLYADDLKDLKPSMLEITFNNNFLLPSRKYKPMVNAHKIDSHPTPLEHYEYLKVIFPEWKFSESTIDKIKENQQTITMLA